MLKVRISKFTCFWKYESADLLSGGTVSLMSLSHIQIIALSLHITTQNFSQITTLYHLITNISPHLNTSSLKTTEACSSLATAAWEHLNNCGEKPRQKSATRTEKIAIWNFNSVIVSNRYFFIVKRQSLQFRKSSLKQGIFLTLSAYENCSGSANDHNSDRKHCSDNRDHKKQLLLPLNIGVLMCISHISILSHIFFYLQMMVLSHNGALW